MANEIMEQNEVEVKENRFKKFIQKIGKKNVIIACAVVLIAAAVMLNWILFAKAEKGNGNYGNYGDNAGETGNNQSGNKPSNDGDKVGQTSTDSFFSSTQITRERARDEAIEVLQSVIDNAAADAASKTQAVADMAKLANTMEAEANIETLVIAKGFEKCVAVINDDSANIVVKTSGTLTPAQLAQINEIVYTQSGIKPANVNIIEK